MTTESISKERLQKAKISTSQICKALDISVPRFRDWRNQGLITPTLPSRGQGTKAGFTRGDVYSIALFKKMSDEGYKRELATSILKKFMGTLHNPIESASHLIVSTRSVEGKSEPVVNHLVGYSTLVMKIDLYEVSMARMSDDDSTHTEYLRNDLLDDWDNFTVFNILKLRLEVDTALEAVK